MGWLHVLFSHSFSLRPNSVHQSATIGVGIDLGTTNSAIAIMKDDRPIIISVDTPKSRTIPSVVAFDEKMDHETSFTHDEIDKNVLPIVGRRAASQPFAYRNVKRVIGTGGNAIPKNVNTVVPGVKRNPAGKTYKKNNLAHRLHDAEHFPTKLFYQTSSMQRNDKDRLISPETISACIIRTLLDAVEEQTNSVVDRAVIGIPAYFDDAQANATIAAGHAAGLSKVKLMREPEAAALAYQYEQDEDEEDLDELLLAFDLGGGTYDVSVLHRVGGGVTEIICTAGDGQLGGSVWDAKLAKHLERTLGVDSNSVGRTKLVLIGEALRIYLSNHKSATIRIPKSESAWGKLVSDEKDWLKQIFVNKGEQAVADEDTIVFTITRSEMERVCEEEWLALLRPLREVAIMAGVLLAGDARPSAVAAALDVEKAMSQRFEDFYDEEGEYQEPETEAELEAAMMRELDPKEAKKAQQGGRKRARELAKKEKRFQREKRKVVEQVSPAEIMASSSVKVRDGIPGRPISRIVLVGGATRMPTIGRLLTQLTGVVPEKTVNPDEAVALGCAVKVSMLDGSSSANQSMLLNPMQAAILKAMAIRDGKLAPDDDEDDDDDYELM